MLSEVRPGGKMLGSASVVASGLSVLIMGGVVFGFSSFYPVLYREHVFRNKCSADAKCSHSDGCCSEQRVWLSLVASCALFAADGIMVAYGELNDRVGPKSCFTVGTVLAVIGFCLMAIDMDETYAVALVLLGLAGPGVFMGCMGFGSFMPDLEHAVTAVCAAMWDSSAVVLLLFALVTTRVPLALFTLAWAGLCLVVGAVTMRLLFVAEKRRKRTSLDDPLLPDEQEPVISALMMRKDTVLLLCFMSLYNLKSAFYIESISDQVRRIGGVDESQAKNLDLTFDIAFPVGGFLTSFLAAKLLSNDRRHSSIFGVVFALATLFSLVQLIPAPEAQYIAAGTFGPARTIQWAAYFHFLMCRYPESAAGRLIGYGNLCIALVGDTIPYALTAFTASAGGVPRLLKYVLVHGVLTVGIVASGFAFLRCLQRESRGHKLLDDDDDDDVIVGGGDDDDTRRLADPTAEAKDDLALYTRDPVM